MSDMSVTPTHFTFLGEPKRRGPLSGESVAKRRKPRSGRVAATPQGMKGVKGAKRRPGPSGRKRIAQPFISHSLGPVYFGCKLLCRKHGVLGDPPFSGERIMIYEDHQIYFDHCPRSTAGRPREPARLWPSQEPSQVHPTPTVRLPGGPGIPLPGLPGDLGPVAGMARTTKRPGFEKSAALYHPLGRQQTPAGQTESRDPPGRRPETLPEGQDSGKADAAGRPRLDRSGIPARLGLLHQTHENPERPLQKPLSQAVGGGGHGQPFDPGRRDRSGPQTRSLERPPHGPPDGLSPTVGGPVGRRGLRSGRFPFVLSGRTEDSQHHSHPGSGSSPRRRATASGSRPLSPVDEVPFPPGPLWAAVAGGDAPVILSPLS
jgi:hypothetical protein